MKSSMAKSSEDLPSKRHFHWTTKVRNQEEEEEEESTAPTLKATNTSHHEVRKKHIDELAEPKEVTPAPSSSQRRKQLQAIAVSRLRSAILTVLSKNRSQPSTLIPSLGTRVVGTLFGYRKGHVHFVFQKHATSRPAFVIELGTPISGLVREMASGLVRIALECDKEKEKEKKPGGREKRLLEETLWRTNCNGKKCGFATRRECGERDWKVLKAVEPISMGAGVLPATTEEKEGDGGEVMYMRAKFERVVGSRDSEAFYMMNPDSNGAPELSIYLLRV